MPPKTMKNIRLLAVILLLFSSPVLTQTTQELLNDGKNTDNVTTQSMGYDRKSYSPSSKSTSPTSSVSFPFGTRA